jgi:hypothetical protein
MAKQGVGRGIPCQFRKPGGQPKSQFVADAGDENPIRTVEDGRDGRLDLISRFPAGQDDLGKSAAQFPVMIDGQIGKRLMGRQAELLNGVIGRGLTVSDGGQ